MIVFISLSILAYLIGSIPTSIWYGRLIHKTDIRKHGSGNAGATNTFRTFGKFAGIFVLFFDVAKGALGVCLPIIYTALSANNLEVEFSNHHGLIFGLATALGHIYPIYENFKGGKGVATLFGAIIAIDPLISAILVASFLIVVIISKRVSLGSMLAAIAFTISYWLFHSSFTSWDILIMVLYPILVIFTHRSNLKRLIRNEEPPFKLKKS